MRKIKGLRAIYEPKGAAREYGALAVNLFNGCTCGCRYCYVPRMPGFPSREVFRAAATLRRPDILDLIERDAVALQAQGNTEPVFLCFTCDPCEPGLVDYTSRAICSLKLYGQRVTLLTKRPSQLYDAPEILRNLARSGSALGVTLTLLDRWKAWEPGMARGRDPDYAIDHDPLAVAMHKANHPGTVHFRQDVWEVSPRQVTRGRDVGVLWASPDCTHFSKAKGGAPRRDQKRRDLAWVVEKWAREVRPRVIFLENVEEFRTWGPLDREGRPIEAAKGETFRAWVRSLRRLGYAVQFKELRACGYGAPTIRKRLFMVARCDGLPIVWPAPTHGPGRPQPWRTAAECIDWSIPCPSIFERKRPLAEKTLRRIAEGIRRYVLGKAEPFIVNLTHGVRLEDAGKPFMTITGAHRVDHNSLVAASLVGVGGRAGQSRPRGAGEPMATVTAKGDTAVVASHLVKLRGTCKAGQPVDEPMATVTAGGLHLGEVRVFLVKYYGQGVGQPVDDPAATVTTKDRMGLVTVMVQGQPYVVADIGMRMLQPRELYRAQGFPDSYVIDLEHEGRALSKSDQVRLCGNSVCPPMAEALVRANYASGLRESRDPLPLLAMGVGA